MCPPALTQSPIRLPLRKAGRAHIKLDGSRIIETEGYPVSGIFLEMHVSTTAVSPRARARHLLLPPFNGPEVRRRGCSYTGVELPEHWETGSSYSEGSSRLIMSSWLSSDISFNASATETPQIGTAQGEAGLNGEGIMVWSTAKGDPELCAEGEEGTVASS